MKKIFVLCIVFISQLCQAQNNALQKVPGTKCSMVPPEGFVAATKFSGFQQEETGASIMITELPAPYKSMVDGFTADALLKKGMTLVNKETIDFNGGKATLIKVTQVANGMTYIKHILLFGDTENTVIVNGIFPEVSATVEGKIKTALLSAVYDANQKDNLLEAVSFTIDVSNTAFQPAKYISGTLLYTMDGNIPTEKPTLIVSNSVAKIPAPQQKEYAVERLKKLPRGEQTIVKETKEITIDNMKGYEITAMGKTKDGTAELIYAAILFDEQGDYYAIIGQTKEAFTQYTSIFRKIAATFKRKK